MFQILCRMRENIVTIGGSVRGSFYWDALCVQPASCGEVGPKPRHEIGASEICNQNECSKLRCAW